MGQERVNLILTSARRHKLLVELRRQVDILTRQVQTYSRAFPPRLLRQWQFAFVLTDSGGTVESLRVLPQVSLPNVCHLYFFKEQRAHYNLNPFHHNRNLLKNP